MTFNIKPTDFRLLMNPQPVRSDIYSENGRDEVLSLSSLAQAKREITSWPGYQETSLRKLDGLARALGIGAVLYKDEGARFGLASFKPLGGAYAVATLLQDEVELRTSTRPATADLASGNLHAMTSNLTVTCATDGNHGKSVAWGARTFGCRCVIYVHSKVSESRRSAIAAYDAEVREVDGTYDDAVRQVAKEAAKNNWKVVSDTSYDGYTDIPRAVMQGYGLIADEIFAQLPPGLFPTHVFVQAGVGGLAASICSYLWERFGSEAPDFYVVEPEKANCIFLSAKAGKPTTDHGALDTIMAGLACGEVSLLAWSILKHGANGFLTISDQAAAETMRLLAHSSFGDEPIVAGESAVAGLSGLLATAVDPLARRQVRLEEKSVALLIGTEGASDPFIYKSLVGKSAEDVSPYWAGI
jgi:diaminopropionate ammonia-lyase